MTASISAVSSGRGPMCRPANEPAGCNAFSDGSFSASGSTIATTLPAENSAPRVAGVASLTPSWSGSPAAGVLQNPGSRWNAPEAVAKPPSSAPGGELPLQQCCRTPGPGGTPQKRGGTREGGAATPWRRGGDG